METPTLLSADLLFREKALHEILRSMCVSKSILWLFIQKARVCGMKGNSFWPKALCAYLASRIPWYSSSCFMKDGFGFVTERRSFTWSKALSRSQPYSFIVYAITVEAERLTPILQCTRHFTPAFLGDKSYIKAHFHGMDWNVKSRSSLSTYLALEMNL